MLVTSKAKFHIRFLPSRWFCTSENGIEEPFLVADKFYQETQKQSSCSFSVQYLSVLGKDSMEENLTVLEQKVTYRKIHGTYKKALCKALQTHSKSEKLISLLEEFVDDSNKSNLEDHESVTDADDSDKENDKIDNSIAFCIKNPKVRHGKGRPTGSKHLKSAHEARNIKTNQRRCKKYGELGHYQKGCKSKSQSVLKHVQDTMSVLKHVQDTMSILKHVWDTMLRNID
ncbi:8581_t:CDS:2 [Cetraspora pellucida]|uniref:8581_t:CDS:1 n=1 Tax=Cetraspora pellucida TaxID=1433469 RepID=A0A9N9CPZ9_9GLOM|nr:8581_t:CDS:2 [Cetraspora pellucida]